jgi:hypothetical protein
MSHGDLHHTIGKSRPLGQNKPEQSMPILYQSIVPEKSPKNLMPNKFAMSDGETDPLNSTNIAFKTDAIKNFHKEEELI